MENIENNFIEEIRNIATKSLKNFYRNLDIDPNLFEHIYNIPIKVEELDDLAVYYSHYFYIGFNKKYLLEMSEQLQTIEVPSYRTKILLNAALVLVHEMIHANRTTIISGGVNSINSETIKKREFLKFIQEQDGYDINHYNSLLEVMLAKDYTSDFETFIPIKTKINRDGTYTVIAYNKKTGDYDQFKDQKFTAVMNEDIDAFINSIGSELNDPTSNHKVNKSIITSTIIEDKSIALTAPSYYHQYDGKLVGYDKSTSMLDYVVKLNEEEKLVKEKINKQEDLEEIITEALATIIIMTRNKPRIDLENVTKEVEAVTGDKALLTGMKLIRAMGTDMVKWFMLSAYEDVYNDKMYLTFQEKYNDLLTDFSMVYKDDKNYSKVERDIDSILDEKGKIK